MSADPKLVRELRQRLAPRLKQARADREQKGLPKLEGEDARQHARPLIDQIVRAYDETDRATQGLAVLEKFEHDALVSAIEAAMFGAGALQPLLDDPTIENVDINGCDNVFVSYTDGTRQRGEPVAASDDELVDMVKNLAAYVGLASRPFDPSNPELDLRLPDGSRLSALMAVTARPIVSIRRNTLLEAGLERLAANGTFDHDVASFLRAAVRSRQNVMIGGETNAGKSALLRALAHEIEPWERIITIERALELDLDKYPEMHPNAIALEERKPNSEGVGGVSMADLLSRTRRHNPDRVIVGEVMGPEIVTMLNAMTQGNKGSLSTIHADTPSWGDAGDSVINKLVTYALQAPEKLSPETTMRLAAQALDFVVIVRQAKSPDGVEQRTIASIREVTGFDGDQVLMSALWDTGRDGRPEWRGNQVLRQAELLAAGWRPPARRIRNTSVDGWAAS